MIVSLKYINKTRIICKCNLKFKFKKKEIIGGILDLDPMDWRRPAKDQFNVQSAKVIEFNKWWKSYDFNKK